MTATHHEQDVPEYPAHFEPPHGPTWRMFFGPGLVRGAWMAVLGFVLGTLLVIALRAWWGWDPLWNTEVILVVGGMVMRADLLPRRNRLLRLLAPLHLGSSDAARGPLGPRCARRGRTTSGSTPITR